MPAKLSHLIIFFALATTISNLRADIVDLSNGVVAPSNNSAIFENPAALGKYKARVVDLAAFFATGGPSTGTASVVSKIGSLGFGLGTFKTDPDRDSLTAALGRAIGDFGHLGVATTIDFQTKNLSWDIGYRGAVSKELALGIVLYHVQGFWPAAWAVGLTPTSTSRIIPELDFLGVSRQAGTWEPSQVTALVGFSLKAFRVLTVRFGLPFRVYPEVQFDASTVEMGISWWFAKSAAIYGEINDHRGPKYVLGLKFQ